MKNKPKIEQWYLATDKKEPFEIIAIDDDTKTIEIQYFSGDIEEIEFDEWRSLNAQEIDQPEDWTGPYEINKEDVTNLLADDEASLNPPNEENPLGE